jgi:hypothetical protein
MERDMGAEGMGDIIQGITDITHHRAILCGNVNVRVTTRTGILHLGVIARNLAAIAGIVTGTNKIAN